MKLYEIEYQRFAALLLPTFLRKPVILSLLNVVAGELENAKGVYTRFKKNREENLLYLKYNSQVCYLRAALNSSDHFRLAINGDKAKEFKITSNDTQNDWLYALEEGSERESEKLILEREPAFAGGSNHLFLCDTAQLQGSSNRFIVHYSKEVITDKLQGEKMCELVNRHRLVSREPVYSPPLNFD